MLRCTLLDFLTEKACEQHRRPYTIREVAQGAGLSQTTVRHLVSNRFSRIDKTTLDRLCKYLHCDPGAWLKWIGPDLVPIGAIVVPKAFEGLDLDNMTPAQAFTQGVWYALNRQGGSDGSD